MERTWSVVTMRFRMDIGVGQYDVFKADYNKRNDGYLIYNKIQPLLKFYFNFVPSDNELFATSLRMFDSVMKLDFWLKVFELEPSHLVRFQFSQISSPFYRKRKPWEHEGSSMVGFNYRYGF